MDFNAAMDDAGDVTVSRARAGLSLGIPIGKQSQLSLGYDYEASGYDFEGATGLIPGTSDPWGTIHTHGFSASFFQRASLRWFWLAGGNVSWSAEESGHLGDGLTGGGFGAAQLAVTEKLLLGFGVSVRSRLEDSAGIYPLFLLDWQISEDVKLTNEGRPGLTLAYTPEKNLTLDLTAAYEFRDFRLDDAGPLPGGVGTEGRLPVSVGITWTPRQQFVLSARAGANLITDYEALDSAGNEVGDDGRGVSAFLAIEGRIRF